jgi:molybdate transport system substrate-binding protein
MNPVVSHTLSSLAAGALLLSASLACADEIKVMASAAIKEAYLELVPVFEKSSGHKVVTIWDGGVNIVKRMRAGEVVDLVILARPAVETLITDGKVAPGGRVDLATAGVGIAVRAGAPRPDISSADAVKRALLSAKSIAYSSGPSGAHIAALLARMGIAEEVKSRIKQTTPGNPVGLAIARGEAEIGFQQMSELLPIAGIDLLGPLPTEIQEITVFSGGVHAGAASPAATRALLQFLTSPGAAPVIVKKGMTPA